MNAEPSGDGNTTQQQQEPKVEIDPELAWTLDPFAQVPEKYQPKKEN